MHKINQRSRINTHHDFKPAHKLQSQPQKTIPRVKPMAKDLLHVLQSDKTLYSDNIIEFLVSLYEEMDFEKARVRLVESVEQVLPKDYFLCDKVDEFASQARLGLFYIYCRIHQSVNITTIAEKIGMTPVRTI
jgi:translation initiation factor 3 subunit E